MPHNNLCQLREGNLLQDDDQFVRVFVVTKKQLRANLPTADPWMVIPHHNERTSSFERSPHVIRLKKWMTSFRRVVVTGSTHPRQATERLAEIDQAKSMQDVEHVGAVLMGCETLDSLNCAKSREDHEARASCLKARKKEGDKQDRAPSPTKRKHTLNSEDGNQTGKSTS